MNVAIKLENDGDGVDLILPDGRKVSIEYSHEHPDEGLPELDIQLPNEMTVNAWRSGLQNRQVSEAAQVFIVLEQEK